MVTATEEDTGKDDCVRPRGTGLGLRHCQCVMLFLGYAIAYTNRTSLSLVVVGIQEEEKRFQKAVLTPGQIGMMLSSFMWGYAVAQVPLAHLVRIWSAKKVLGIGLLINGLISISTPIIFDEGGWMYLCASRVVMGLCQACLPSCCHTVLSKWVPLTERGRLSSATLSGSELGAIVSLPITGALIDAAGWRSPSYVFGAAALIWSAIFFLIGSDSPATASGKSCCGISDAEKKYIESSLGVSEGGTAAVGKKSSKTPWLAILTSPPFWALLIAHCGQKWGYYMLLTEIPIYMDGALGFNIKENGVKSAIPYIVLLLLTFLTSCLSDWGEKKGVSRGLLRKLCNTVGHWGPALALVGLCFVSPGDTTLSVVLLVVAVGMNAGAMCGFQINHLDLSLEYAGLLMSITNGMGSAVGLLSPLVVGLIVTDSKRTDQWQTVFLMTAGIYFVGNLIFITLGSGKTQWWDNSEDSDECDKKESWRPRKSSIAVSDAKVP
ncbi:putative inorganic phosphate cotransporter [Diachasma alloeum]|uniref:putative inorganic phosphate cotransporter n=1 Tax=Diachasma alloeum TaxID=454923 RepID=UPI0007382A3E|nr:putative inorganic phosphate cotransporter [Diachasma alloeum]